MIKPSGFYKISLCLALTAALLVACGGRRTITESITETEFNQEAVLCRSHGLDADLQPGKIVCSGDIEGQAVVVDIIAEIVGDNIIFQIVSATADGGALSPDKYAELNAEMSAEIYEPNKGYAITSVVITDNEMTVTMQRK